MARKHRRPNYPKYADDDSSRELIVFVSSLVIGICIGGFGYYFLKERSHGREIAVLRAELATANARQTNCPPQQGLLNGQREELESRLSNCAATLDRLRRATEDAARANADPDGPPLPKPPPGRVNERPLAPASVLPPDEAVQTPAASTISPSRPAAVAEPVEPRPPMAWPQGWPPRPRLNPPRPAGTVPTVETINAAALGTISGPTAALAGAQTVTLDVGQEREISGYRIRLIAISRRNTGRYCIVGGNGMVSQRIATGTGKRVNWNGHNVTLQATVRDQDTCQIALKPG